ncbi:MAG TPA: acetyltransferase [Tepidisphaeraceae bacterium]|nr:acetyltransferase [Tepidisphaeraceae bacterium]
MDVVIVGAGGHGKVVLDILRAEAKHKVVGFVDADLSLAGANAGGLPVLGAPNMLPRLRQQKVRGAIVAIGDNRARLEYAELLKEHGFELLNAIHPSASISSSASLGVNIVVAMQAAICAEARIDDSAIINTAAVVDHECDIGEGAHICPGVHLAGRVRVGACAFVGIGANVIQCLTIGEHAIIGAGAVVTSDVPDYATAVGVPARVIKTAAISPKSFACA